MFVTGPRHESPESIALRERRACERRATARADRVERGSRGTQSAGSSDPSDAKRDVGHHVEPRSMPAVAIVLLVSAFVALRSRSETELVEMSSAAARSSIWASRGTSK